MAKIEVIVPFILHFEAGVSLSYLSKSPEEIFAQAKKTGLANDPDDRGGLTMCGVTYATYCTYCNKKKKRATTDGLRNLQYSEWLDILKTMFWDKWKADEIKDQSVANILVDFVWASGITGIKRPQKILGVTVDGIVGPKTLAAVNTADSAKLFAQIHAYRLKHFDEIVARSPSQNKFLKGWRRRVNGLCYGSFKFT